ncbi:MAG: hypothetical protein ACM3SY_17630 [Candidatus Omnitrophota bacterium]
MVDEKQKQKNNQMESSDDIVGEYLKPKFRTTKFWLWVILFLIFGAMAYIYKATVIDTTIDPKELKASIVFSQIRSQWIESEKIDTPDFKGIVLVPQIAFRIRNIGKTNLQHVYFLGVFRLLENTKTLGEGFGMAFKKPVKPGQESEEVVLTSKFGYRATSKRAFYTNAKDWQSAMVQIFARSGTSNLVALKSFYIDRRIQGLEVDVTIIGGLKTDKSVSKPL